MNSYTEMRQKIKANHSYNEACDMVQQEVPLVMAELARQTRPCYLLDYRTGYYVFFNTLMSRFSNYDRTQILKKGLEYTERLWHPDDWHTYDHYILPAILSFLKKQPKARWPQFEIILNYRIKTTHKSGINYFHVMQTSSYLKFSGDGLPLLTRGAIDNSQTPNDSRQLDLKILFDDKVSYEQSFISISRKMEALTKMEIKICKRHYCENISAKEIAAETNTSINTVNTHLKSIRNKIDLKGRDDLIKIFVVQIGVCAD